MITALYSITIFVGAFLIFQVQPMVAKMVLPRLGGSPSVWNTCMVFFQAALLAGYAYAHLIARIRRPIAQVGVHAVVVLVPLLVLPMGLPAGWNPTETAHPEIQLLGLLVIMVGLPFLVVSTTGPLIQEWYSRTGAAGAADPYFLYAASNAGSLLGLLAYPFAVEPALTLGQQSWWWAVGFGLYAGLVVLCGVVRWRREGIAPAVTASAGRVGRKVQREEAGDTMPRLGSDRPIWVQRAWWVGLSALASSLMLSVSLFLSTDVAAMPLLWVLPLSVYLLTFIFAFARRNPFSPERVAKFLPLAAVGLCAAQLAEVLEEIVLLITLHLVVLFLGAMLCHGLLARRRPEVSRLTEYYLLMSLGGVIGGVFNSLLAPRMFNDVYEFPLALAAVCALLPAVRFRSSPEPAASAGPAEAGVPLPRWKRVWRWRGMDLMWPVVVAAWGMFWFWFWREVYWRPLEEETPPPFWNALREFSVAVHLGTLPSLVFYVIATALLALLAWKRPARLALCILALFVFWYAKRDMQYPTMWRDRTFFGIYHVERDEYDYRRVLMHGTTRHGQQIRASPELRAVPMSYYHPTGPIGQVFETYKADPRFRSVAVVGMGVGTMAAYARRGQAMSFYEIDPVILRLATNRNMFTYMGDAFDRGAILNAYIGDARLKLAQAEDGLYGIIVLDAFSSDAIPVHLMTLEAVEMYRRKMMPDGMLAFHISNRHLDLTPLLASIATKLGMRAIIQDDGGVSDSEMNVGKYASTWVLLVNNLRDVTELANGRWTELKPLGEEWLWTDDFSNMLKIMRD
ncbi:MAG: fused MFS/spermidine synthase [Phycisphaerae bacterium]|nr:fused MFS/spermidine synthase [Phycisphaerae bacterium]